MATVKDASGNSPIGMGVEATISTQFFQQKDGITAPSAKVGMTRIYTDAADGDLKVKFGDGVTKVLAADT